jgi:carbamoyl-phosphate synthase large subunit
MNICYSRYDLEQYIDNASVVSEEYPITVSKFFEKSKEIEFDGVAQRGSIKASIISEHVENAGVHSGDATVMLPTQDVTEQTKIKVHDVGTKLAKALKITGPFNIQFLAKNNEIYVIELNARASRTFPFISKVLGVNFIDLFVQCLFEKRVAAKKMLKPHFIAVKVPQFSFSRLLGADPVLRVEMASTGEVACFGKTPEEAFLKGFLSVGGRVPEKGIFVSLGGTEKKERFLESARLLTTLDIPLYATEKTSLFLRENGVLTTMLYKIHEKKSPNMLDYFRENKIDLAINIVDRNIKKDIDDDYISRRATIDNNIPLFTKIKNARLFVKAITQYNNGSLKTLSWKEYKEI